ncbi:MAG: BamA/TamA family outer membrane protein [Acidobacteria bacterium]|nr:BamA/TamA family outer membrane protein [Acidobacteriota bacterium]
MAPGRRARRVPAARAGDGARLQRPDYSGTIRGSGGARPRRRGAVHPRRAVHGRRHQGSSRQSAPRPALCRDPGAHSDRGTGRFDFSRLDVEASYYFPFFLDTRVIAVRAILNTTSAGPGGDVPFFLLPTLGGSKSLRSFTNSRFRDRTAAAVNLEYRWEAVRFLEMALFTDAGSVAPRLADLARARLHRSYGIGARFKHRGDRVVFRVEVAGGGGEGARLLVGFKPPF